MTENYLGNHLMTNKISVIFKKKNPNLFAVVTLDYKKWLLFLSQKFKDIIACFN